MSSRLSSVLIFRQRCRMSHAVTHHHRPLAWYSMRRSADYSSRQETRCLSSGIPRVYQAINQGLRGCRHIVPLYPYHMFSIPYRLWLQYGQNTLCPYL